MTKDFAADEKKQIKRPEMVDQAPAKQQPTGPELGAAAVLRLQKQVGNRAVQRLLTQREGGADGFDLDEETASRINRARGSGQALDGTVQKQMSEGMGYDFSNVRVHTSPESDELNQQLSAKAFTTGADIFFKQGEYDPHSGSGRELLAHELTHVVQQGTGRVGGSGGGMTVRPAGDAFEQEADALAKQAVNPGSDNATQTMGGVQRQEEEEEIQMKPLQRQEDEEEIQMKTLQRQEEEEEIQMKPLQRQEDEEEIQMKTLQHQEEEEEIQMKQGE